MALSDGRIDDLTQQTLLHQISGLDAFLAPGYHSPHTPKTSDRNWHRVYPRREWRIDGVRVAMTSRFQLLLRWTTSADVPGERLDYFEEPARQVIERYTRWPAERNVIAIVETPGGHIGFGEMLHRYAEKSRSPSAGPPPHRSARPGAPRQGS